MGGTRAHEYMDANDAALEESIMKSENIGNFSQSPCDLEERSERAKALMDATELAMMSAISICQANTPVSHKYTLTSSQLTLILDFASQYRSTYMTK